MLYDKKFRDKLLVEFGFASDVESISENLYEYSYTQADLMRTFGISKTVFARLVSNDYEFNEDGIQVFCPANYVVRVDNLLKKRGQTLQAYVASINEYNRNYARRASKKRTSVYATNRSTANGLRRTLELIDKITYGRPPLRDVFEKELAQLNIELPTLATEKYGAQQS